MKNPLNTLLSLAACFLLAGSSSALAQDKKADPTGTWTWSTPGRDGQTRESTLKLKLEGDKLTGSMSGRQGTETAIEQAKITGDEVSFVVAREFNGNKFSLKYVAKVSADTLKGKVEFEREGEKQSRDWEAKRKVEKKDGN